MLLSEFVVSLNPEVLYPTTLLLKLFWSEPYIYAGFKDELLVRAIPPVLNP